MTASRTAFTDSDISAPPADRPSALYAADITPLTEGRWRGFLACLDQARAQQALRMRQDADAARTVGAGLLLRYALAGFGFTGQEAEIQRTAHGKPCLPGGPCFSLSHAGSFAAAAISMQPIGVDLDTARCTMSIARHFFSQDEVRFLERLSGPEQASALAKCWTAKESFLKALGTGLAGGLDSFSVFPSADGSFVLEQALSPLPFTLKTFELPGYFLTVAAVSPPSTLSLVTVEDMIYEKPV